MDTATSKTTVRRARNVVETALKVHDDLLQQSAFYRIPVVPKNIRVGKRGGTYYVNSRGRKVYLKLNQLTEWQRRELKGCVRNCGGARRESRTARILRRHLRKI